jgi:hypothetical protein
MKLATLMDGTPDGRLHLVSRYHVYCAPAMAATTLQSALENWERVETRLRIEYEALNARGGEPLRSGEGGRAATAPGSGWTGRPSTATAP